ncbi:WD40-repeat-containing domain protein [Pelagophyceae sp. CCMP2097]|nr:WD40-repeat-containing domain protein [Pelagophyceae sp. CCMP2097]
MGAPRAVLAHGACVNCVAVYTTVANEPRVVCGSRDAHVYVWDPVQARVIHKLAGHAKDVLAVACHAPSAAQRRIVSGSVDASVRVWDGADGKCMAVLRHADWVTALTCFDAGSRGWRVASAARDGTLRVWNVAAKGEVVVCGGLGDAVAGVAHVSAARGGIVVAACHDHKLHAFDAASGKRLFALSGHSGAVNCAASFRDASQRAFFVSGSNDATARIWDADDPKSAAVRVCRGHGGPVLAVAALRHRPLGDVANRFSGATWYVATASADASVRIWATAGDSDGPLRSLRGHFNAVAGLAVADHAGAQVLATAAMDGNVCVWDLDDDDGDAVWEPVDAEPARRPASHVADVPGVHGVWVRDNYGGYFSCAAADAEYDSDIDRC